MAYIERDEGDLNLNDQTDIYDDDSLYEEMYEAENFGERVGSNDDEVVEMETDESTVSESHSEPAEVDNEDGFGETINAPSETETSDTADNQTQAEGSVDESSGDTKKEGLFTKAKEKLDEWTDKDERE